MTAIDHASEARYLEQRLLVLVIFVLLTAAGFLADHQARHLASVLAHGIQQVLAGAR